MEKYLACKNLGLFVGTSACNARCAHCAGLQHRIYAPTKDMYNVTNCIVDALKACPNATSLSISSSGEPTLSPLSVTGVLMYVHENYKNFTNIHLYTNGIRIGIDSTFCDTYLKHWASLGLCYIYMTVHSMDAIENARMYGVKHYPDICTIVNKIHDAGIRVRANIVLGKNTVATFHEFKTLVERGLNIGFDAFAAWNVRDVYDNIDVTNKIEDAELKLIQRWVKDRNYDNVFVYNEHNHINDYSNNVKMTLFPNGILSNTWCKHG